MKTGILRPRRVITCLCGAHPVGGGRVGGSVPVVCARARRNCLSLGSAQSAHVSTWWQQLANHNPHLSHIDVVIRHERHTRSERQLIVIAQVEVRQPGAAGSCPRRLRARPKSVRGRPWGVERERGSYCCHAAASLAVDRGHCERHRTHARRRTRRPGLLQNRRSARASTHVGQSLCSQGQATGPVQLEDEEGSPPQRKMKGCTVVRGNIDRRRPGGAEA